MTIKNSTILKKKKYESIRMDTLEMTDKGCSTYAWPGVALHSLKVAEEEEILENAMYVGGAASVKRRIATEKRTKDGWRKPGDDKRPLNFASSYDRTQSLQRSTSRLTRRRATVS